MVYVDSSPWDIKDTRLHMEKYCRLPLKLRATKLLFETQQPMTNKSMHSSDLLN